MFDYTFDNLMNEVDSNSVDAYYNYASDNNIELIPENVDWDYFSIQVYAII